MQDTATKPITGQGTSEGPPVQQGRSCADDTEAAQGCADGMGGSAEAGIRKMEQAIYGGSNPGAAAEPANDCSDCKDAASAGKKGNDPSSTNHRSLTPPPIPGSNAAIRHSGRDRHPLSTAGRRTNPVIRSPDQALLMGNRSPNQALLIDNRSPDQALLTDNRSPDQALLIDNRSPDPVLLTDSRFPDQARIPDKLSRDRACNPANRIRVAVDSKGLRLRAMGDNPRRAGACLGRIRPTARVAMNTGSLFRETIPGNAAAADTAAIPDPAEACSRSTWKTSTASFSVLSTTWSMAMRTRRD